MDIIDNKCVRLTRGDYSTRREYSASTLDTAMMFESNGIAFLHVVDLDAALTGKPSNLKAVEEIVSKTSLSVDYGGGVRSTEDLRRVLDCGVSQVSCGSIAVTDPNLFMYWLSRYGPGRIILGADSNNRTVATHGWQKESGLDVIEYIKSYNDLGVSTVICTDISRDGMLGGPALDLYSEILSSTGVRLIASGGISSINDLCDLKKLKCEGAIVGKALYEGSIDLKQLKDYAEKEDNTLS